MQGEAGPEEGQEAATSGRGNVGARLEVVVQGRARSRKDAYLGWASACLDSAHVALHQVSPSWSLSVRRQGSGVGDQGEGLGILKGLTGLGFRRGRLVWGFDGFG